MIVLLVIWGISMSVLWLYAMIGWRMQISHSERLRDALNRWTTRAAGGFYEFIKHGDDRHKAWLDESIQAFSFHEPRPPLK